MADVSPKTHQTKQWGMEKRIYCVKLYYKTRSYATVQADFARAFKAEKVPSKSIIFGWIKKFEEEGTVRNLNSKTEGRLTHSGRKRIRTEEVIESVRDSVIESPKRSTRKRCQLLGLTCSTLLRVLHDDLKKYPYRIQMHQKLTNVHKEKRLAISNWFLSKIESSKSFLAHLWTSDEAHFHLDGTVNSKNNVYWGSERPSEVTQKPLHSKKVTAWAAISMKGLIGPLFFEDENGATATVNTDRYIVILEAFWKELEEHYKGYIPKFWFQQDGATPHTSNKSLEWVQKHFKNRVISLKTTHEWAPHSPDLSPPDFYLWGYLKDRVYAKKPRTLIELKKNIQDEMNSITTATRKSVMQNFVLRLEKCANLRGGHLEHIL